MISSLPPIKQLKEGIHYFGGIYNQMIFNYSGRGSSEAESVRLSSLPLLS